MAETGSKAPRASHYEAYKGDTNCIASWLAITARACGYSSDAESAYVIARKDFITLAAHVAASTKPRIDVPVSILKLLKRAITLRKRHAAWFTRGPSEKDPKSNATHEHFVGVLEEVFNLLKHRCSAPAPADPADAPAEDGQFTNLFANLDMEMPSEEFLVAPGATVANPRPEEKFVVEPDRSVDEKLLAAHCLFMDLGDIRSFVRKVWGGYEGGSFGLVPCSLITFTAISLARRLQTAFETDMGSRFDYPEMATLLLGSHCIHHGIDLEAREQSDDLMNVEACGAASNVMLPTYVLLRSFMDGLQGDELPLPKPGSFGPYDPRSDRSKKTDREKLQEDKVVLMEALPGVCWLARDQPPIEAEDYMITMAREMMESRAIDLWGVFAAQVFIEINRVLRENCDRGLRDLRQTGKAIHMTLRKNLEFHKKLRDDNWPPKNDEALEAILDTFEQYVANDPVRRSIQDHVSSFCGVFSLDQPLTSL